MIDIDLGSLAVYSAEPGTRREPTVTGAASLGQGDRNRLIGKWRRRGRSSKLGLAAEASSETWDDYVRSPESSFRKAPLTPLN